MAQWGHGSHNGEVRSRLTGTLN